MTKEDILKFIPAEFAAGNEDIENEEALYNKSDVLKAMDEYAKQQAIAFGFHVLGADPNDPEMGGVDTMSKTYNSFMKQQNKQ